MLSNGREISAQIVAEVAKFYQVKPEEIRGRSHAARISWARHVAAYFVLHFTGATMAQAAAAVAHKSHKTALIARQRVNDAVSIYPEVKKEIEQLEYQMGRFNQKRTNYV